MNQVLPPPTFTTPPPTLQPEPAAAQSTGLVRPRDGRMLGGVCAGLADRYGWSRRTTRVLAVLSLLLPGPQILLYLGLWLFVPDAGDGNRIVDIDKARQDVSNIVGGNAVHT